MPLFILLLFFLLFFDTGEEKINIALRNLTVGVTSVFLRKICLFIVA